MGKLVKLSTPLVSHRLAADISFYRLSLYAGEAVADAHSWFVRAAEGGYAAAMYVHTPPNQTALQTIDPK